MIRILLFYFIVSVDATLYTGLKSGEVHFWETTSSIPTYILAAHVPNQVLCMKTLSNGNLATGSNDHTIRIWTTFVANVTGPPLVLNGHTDNVNSLEQLHQNNNGHLVSASSDHSIIVWNITSGQQVTQISNAHSDAVLCLKMLRLGTVLYMASGGGASDKSVKIWNMINYTLVATLNGHTNQVNVLEILYDGSLASGSNDTTLKIWNVTKTGGNLIDSFIPSGFPVTTIKSLNNMTIAVLGTSDTAYIWTILAPGSQLFVINVTFNLGAMNYLTSIIIYRYYYLTFFSNTGITFLYDLRKQTANVTLADLPIVSPINCAEQSLQVPMNTSTTTQAPLSSTSEESSSSSTYSSSDSSSTTTSSTVTTTNSITTSTTTTTTATTLLTSTSTSTITSTVTSTSTYTTSTITDTTTSIVAATTTTATTPFDPSSHPNLFNTTFTMDDLNSSTYTSALTSDYDMNYCIVNCSNRGVCRYDANRTFSCSCQSSYTGSWCQVDTNPCSQSPCLNNGTCIVTTNSNSSSYSYYCECASWLYTGGNCQTTIDLCELRNETCSNNGYCSVSTSNNSTQCNCYSSFSGDHCEITSKELQAVKALVSSASIIAIISIVVLYVYVIIMDVLKYLCNRNKAKKRELNKKRKKLRDLLKQKKPVFKKQ